MVNWNGYTQFSIPGFSSGIYSVSPEEYRGWFIFKRPIPPYQATGSWYFPFQEGGQWSLSIDSPT
ncbi:hypothetical protein BCM43_29165 (plasmid) [Bacillus thuringiensis]|jgi:hypothetical protein|nr:hypothetical protein BCM43_29165 [Bacillus thuringiensis]